MYSCCLTPNICSFPSYTKLIFFFQTKQHNGQQYCHGCRQSWILIVWGIMHFIKPAGISKTLSGQCPLKIKQYQSHQEQTPIAKSRIKYCSPILLLYSCHYAIWPTKLFSTASALCLQLLKHKYLYLSFVQKFSWISGRKNVSVSSSGQTKQKVWADVGEWNLIQELYSEKEIQYFCNF